jgi:HAT1-interacting factor 1
LYGKALFQVAQKNSEVLGGAPASDPSFGMTHNFSRLILDPKQVLASAAAATTDTKPTAKISFSGDAEEDAEDEDGEDEQEEEKEDDFQIAWEVLETAKMLYESQLESKKGKAVVGKGSSEDISIERKIADVCDLLGEVSIENGNASLSSGY